MDSTDIWGGAPEILPAGGANNAVLQSASSVVIYPQAAFDNALVDAVASAAAAMAARLNSHKVIDSNNGPQHMYDGMRGIHLNVDMTRAKEGIKLINNNLGADAEYLRAKMHDAEAVLERDIQDIGAIVKHRGTIIYMQCTFCTNVVAVVAGVAVVGLCVILA